jgi:hypothetical protein
VVAGAGIYLGVQATSGSGSGPGHSLVVIPAAPAVTAIAQAEPSAIASGTASDAGASAQSQPSPHPLADPGPVAGRQYAGPVVLNATGSQLLSWNQTATYCRGQSWQVANGSVYGDGSADAVLATNGEPGSCVALISPQTYASAVIEAYVYFPPLPGHAQTIADWSSVWLTDQAAWPTDGELDAVEAEPVTGVNAVAWHWGWPGGEQSVSTDGLAAQGTLPRNGPNLTPGWHVIDIAYTQGFFAVYYDARLFTSLQSGAITGAPLNLLITSGVTPDIGAVEQIIGGPPVNSDSQPAGLAVKYVKVWSFR